ncbi:MAG: glycosyltransferase family 39 protein [Planctomycetes bacterium]|nr:glycosyltransferase family 39 protein [Planctomycetota bacterium]
MRSIGRYKSFAALLLCAFLLRAGAAVLVQQRLDRTPGRSFVIPGDAAGYWELGRRLAAGEAYAVHDPPRRAMRMPGFPLLLSGVMSVAGESFLVVRLVLALVGTAACLLVYALAREVADRSTALAATVLAAVSPPFIGFSVLVLSETLFAAAMLLSLLGLAKLWRVDRQGDGTRRTLALAAAAGGAVSLAVYVRPTWLLIAPAAAIALVAASRHKLRALAAAALLCVTALAVLAPWAVRNRVVTGHWVLTTLWVGPSLYDGLNPDATGDSDMSFFDRDALNQRLTEYEVDRHYRRKALEFVREHPGRTLELARAKLWRFWKPWPNAEQFQSLPAVTAVAAFFVPLMVLAIVGVWAHRRDARLLALCAAPVLYFSAVHTVFVSSLRYRLPGEYPLCILAAAGLMWFVRRRRSAQEQSTV